MVVETALAWAARRHVYCVRINNREGQPRSKEMASVEMERCFDDVAGAAAVVPNVECVFSGRMVEDVDLEVALKAAATKASSSSAAHSLVARFGPFRWLLLSPC
jgi:hypothetical protein